jgi:DNA-binding XRE family transcriptional regulator
LKNKSETGQAQKYSATRPFSEYKAMILKDPGVCTEYMNLAPEFEVIAALIKLRIRCGMSQKDLAAAIGTRQPAIARLESGVTKGVALTTLVKIARILKAKLTLVPVEE